MAHMVHILKPALMDLKRVNLNIDLTQLKKQHSKSLFEVNENLDMVVAAAKKLREHGIVVVNLGSNDILDMNKDVVLGLGNDKLSSLLNVIILIDTYKSGNLFVLICCAVST
jgi:hypothetical protein